MKKRAKKRQQASRRLQTVLQTEKLEDRRLLAVTDMLVSHHKLDEGSGTSAADSAGGDNTGTLNNGASFIGGGIIGGAVRLDGGNDYVELANESDFDFLDNTMSVSVWMKVDSDGFNDSWEAIVAKGENPTWRMARFNNTNGAAIAAPNSDLINNTNVNDQQWHHLLAVRGPSNEQRIYTDGVLSNSNTASNLGNTSNPVQFGRNPNNGRNFGGDLDDIGIWDRTLSDQEVAAIHGLGLLSGVDLSDAKIDEILDMHTAGSGVVTGVGPGGDIYEYAKGLSTTVATVFTSL